MKLRTDRKGGSALEEGRAIIARYRALAQAVPSTTLVLLASAMVDFDNFIPYGNLDTSPNPIAAVGRGLRDSLCALHSTVPYAYRVPIPNPISDTIEDVWNDICDRPSAPPGNVPASAGGCPIDYQVSASWLRPDGSTGNFTTTRSSVVAAFWQSPLPPPGVNGRGNLVVRFCGGSETVLFVGDDGFSVERQLNVEITPLGQETEGCCGDPPFIPPTNPALPPVLDIDIGTGPITIPVQWPGAEFNFDGDLIGFDPIIITPIGRFNFDLGGLTFSPRFNLAPDVTIPIGGGDSGQGGATPSEVATIVDNSAINTVNQLTQVIQQSECDLTPVLQAIDELDFQIDLAETLALVRCYILGGGGTIQSQSLVTNSAGGTWGLPEGTFAVLFELQTPPTQATPIQKAEAGAPDIFFWGSYSVNLTADGNGDRKPLHFANQVVPVEPGSNSVTMLPVYQNIASVAAIQRLPVCEQPQQFLVPVDQPNPITTQTLGDGSRSNGVPG